MLSMFMIEKWRCAYNNAVKKILEFGEQNLTFYAR